MLRELTGVREDAVQLGADAVAEVRETLQNAEADDPSRPGRVARLRTLRDFLARAHALSLEPGAAQELFDLPQRLDALSQIALQAFQNSWVFD